MIDLILGAIALAAQPVALVGYIVLGVWARNIWQAAGYAAGWAVAMQLFVTLTGGSFAGPTLFAGQLALRLIGAVVLTLAIYLLYRVLRGGGAQRGPGGGSGGGSGKSKRPGHLRRVK